MTRGSLRRPLRPEANAVSRPASYEMAPAGPAATGAAAPQSPEAATRTERPVILHS